MQRVQAIVRTEQQQMGVISMLLALKSKIPPFDKQRASSLVRGARVLTTWSCAKTISRSPVSRCLVFRGSQASVRSENTNYEAHRVLR